MTHNHRLTPDRFERAVRGAHRSWCLACQGEGVDDDPRVPVSVMILGQRDCVVSVMDDDDGEAGLFERVLSAVAAYGSAAHVEATIFCSTGRMTTLSPDNVELGPSLAICTLGLGPEGHVVSLLSSEAEGIHEELRRPLYGRVLEAMRTGMEFASNHGQQFLGFLGQHRDELRQVGINLDPETALDHLLPDVGCVLDRLLAADDEGFPWPGTD